MSRRFLIVVISVFLFFLLTGCRTPHCDYKEVKECYLTSNTALGEISHRVSCNKEYTYYQLNNNSKDCFPEISERTYD